MNRYLIIALCLIIFAVFAISCAQVISHAQETNPDAIPTPASLEEQKLAIDRERLKLEQDKFKEETKRENNKLELEAKKAWLTAGSLVFPLMAALGTLFYSIWSFRKQLRENSNQQERTAKLQFEIKAAEIAFSGKTPEAVLNRATVLKKMFGDRLPRDFPTPLNAGEHGGKKEPSEEKQLLLKLLMDHYDRRAEIVLLWEALFPFDRDWLDRVKALVDNKSVGLPNDPVEHLAPASQAPSEDQSPKRSGES